MAGVNLARPAQCLGICRLSGIVRYHLSKARDALARVESGRSKGKVLIEVRFDGGVV